ncbi:MAG: helix-turn-helix transcriptional regulator [Anaerolineaceae bacterium]|nr:helix-turn-helix transcriptional regulator [Anaerolineaceae bacterium]
MSDQESINRKYQKELNAGIASLVLLSVLDLAVEPLYGYQISKMVGAGKENGISMKQSALYPVLRSLEGNGLLSSQVEPSVSGPPRRYYQVTPLGKTILVGWKNTWHSTKTYVNSILEGEYRD